MKKQGVEIRINLSNRVLYTLIVIGILAIVGVGVYAASVDKTKAWHDESQVEVTIGSTAKSLQDAIDDGNFNDGRCDTSGTCSKLCIGTDCKGKWSVPGWEIIESNPLSGEGGGKSPSVSCSSGKKLLGGGCKRSSTYTFFYSSYPLDDNTWKCEFSEAGSIAYAICAYTSS